VVLIQFHSHDPQLTAPPVGKKKMGMKWLQDLIRFLKKNATREGSPQDTPLKTF